jgi:hypothetical protein
MSMVDPILERIANADSAQALIQELIYAKARICELEGANAHCHQAMENLAGRVVDLEAALREIADFSEQFIGDDEDGDERMYKVNQIADTAGRWRALMFSVKQKRDIADAVQKILRATGHPELPTGEIQFALRVAGAESWSWADIRNNGAVQTPGVNLWNEAQDRGEKP